MIEQKKKDLKNFNLNIPALAWLISYIIFYLTLCFMPIQNMKQSQGFILFSVLITFLVISEFLVSSILIIHNIKRFGEIGSNSTSIFISICILTIIVTFAIAYRLIDVIDCNSFKYNGEMNNAFDILVNWLYFSVITFTSLGYGDIVPVSNVAKVFVSIEAIIFTVIISFIIMNFKSKTNENKEKDTEQNEENNNE